jgi:ABC-type nitrate/sulfonate/bicarbonate transport system permease component
VAGLTIGFALGMRRTAAEVFEPFLLAGNSVPKIALYLIMLLIFDIGMPAKIAFGAIHGVLPVTIFALTACCSVGCLVETKGRNAAPILLHVSALPGSSWYEVFVLHARMKSST